MGSHPPLSNCRTVCCRGSRGPSGLAASHRGLASPFPGSGCGELPRRVWSHHEYRPQGSIFMTKRHRRGRPNCRAPGEDRTRVYAMARRRVSHSTTGARTHRSLATAGYWRFERRTCPPWGAMPRRRVSTIQRSRSGQDRLAFLVAVATRVPSGPRPEQSRPFHTMSGRHVVCLVLASQSCFMKGNIDENPVHRLSRATMALRLSTPGEIRTPDNPASKAGALPLSYEGLLTGA